MMLNIYQLTKINRDENVENAFVLENVTKI